MADIQAPLRGYLRRHWEGRQSLAWSFWVNLVLLRIAILGLDRFTRPPFIEDPTAVALATCAFFGVFHIAVFAWQVVGVIRACDAHQSRFGAGSLTLVAYFGIAGIAALTLISVIGAFLALVQPPEGEADYLAWERARAARYSLTLDARNGELLRFSGSFELGVTKRLAVLLERLGAVRGIVLDSPGGQVYEGRGFANLIQRHGLDTYVTGNCSSACTTAFIAGRNRVLGSAGRLGFHQHLMEADYPVYLVDEESEMRKDLAFFEAQGISEAFRDRVFLTPHDRLWFPSQDELLEAGVVIRIGGPPQ